MDPDPTARITGILRANPKGIGITRVAQKAGIHRSTAIKYLELLRASGQAEMQTMGMTKLYSLSQRVPLSAMLDLQDIIFVVIDDRGRIVQVNERYEAICGLSHERVIGIVLGKSDLPILTDPEILATIKSLERPEILARSYRIPGVDGARHYRIRIIPTVFEGGKTGVTVIGVDITSEQEISHQLSVTETRYQAILDQLPDMVCSFSPDFTIIQANRAFRGRFGGRKSKYAGENFLNMVYGKDYGEIKPLLASLSENALSFIHEQHVVSHGGGKGKGGHNLWIRWHYHAEYDAPGTLVKIQATGTEITSEKELGEKVGQQNRDLEFLSQKAFEFAHHPPDTDIYEVIGNGVLQLVPDAIISYSSYDPKTCSLTVRTLVGDRNKIFIKYFPGQSG